jgi:hypothetical protein
MLAISHSRKRKIVFNRYYLGAGVVRIRLNGSVRGSVIESVTMGKGVCAVELEVEVTVVCCLEYQRTIGVAT